MTVKDVEVVMTYLRHCTIVCIELRKETVNNFSEAIRCLVLESNPGLPEYKMDVLSFKPLICVSFCRERERNK